MVQRVLRHTISTSKVYFDIALVALHTYADLHTHLPVQMHSYIHFSQYYILPSTQTHTHLPLYRYVYTSIHLPTHTHVSTTHTHCF